MTKAEILAEIRKRYSIILLREAEHFTLEDGTPGTWYQANVLDEDEGVKRNISFYVLAEGTKAERAFFQNKRTPWQEPTPSIRQDVEAFIDQAIAAGKLAGAVVEQVSDQRGFAIVRAWIPSAEGLEEKRLFVDKDKSGKWRYRVIAA